MMSVVFFLDLTNTKLVDVVLQFVDAGHNVTVHHITELQAPAPCPQ
jgi:hypothetical protein